MKKHELESWVRQIVEQVKKKRQIEDSRVELKADWIPPEKAARRIAGHANAAGGEPILWLIGVDENGNVIGPNASTEFSDWFNQVKKHFNDLIPAVCDLIVPIDGISVVALLFETDRAPYLIKRGEFLEVPWREATAVRSATRGELLRLLTPAAKLPKVEIRSAELNVQMEHDDQPWTAEIVLYVTPPIESTVVFPCHLCECRVRMSEKPQTIYFRKLQFDAGTSPSVTVSSSEAIFSAPGEVRLTATITNRGVAKMYKCPAIIDLRLTPAVGEGSVQLSQELHLPPDDMCVYEMFHGKVIWRSKWEYDG